MPGTDTRTALDLQLLLDSVDDTREFVVRRHEVADLLAATWEAARDEARLAWEAWAVAPTADRWAVYLAAEDRADAAVAALRR